MIGQLLVKFQFVGCMSFTYCPSAVDIVLGMSLLLCAVDSNVFKDTLCIVPTDAKSVAILALWNHLVGAKTPFYISQIDFQT